MSIRTSEWIIAGATLATGIFVGWQSLLLKEAVSAPFRQNIHQIQVENCTSTVHSVRAFRQNIQDYRDSVSLLLTDRIKLFSAALLASSSYSRILNEHKFELAFDPYYSGNTNKEIILGVLTLYLNESTETMNRLKELASKNISESYIAETERIANLAFSDRTYWEHISSDMQPFQQSFIRAVEVILSHNTFKGYYNNFDVESYIQGGVMVHEGAGPFFDANSFSIISKNGDQTQITVLDDISEFGELFLLSDLDVLESKNTQSSDEFRINQIEKAYETVRSDQARLLNNLEILQNRASLDSTDFLSDTITKVSSINIHALRNNASEDLSFLQPILERCDTLIRGNNPELY